MKLTRLGLTFMVLGLTITILAACSSVKPTNPDSLSAITSPQTSDNNKPTTSSQAGSSSGIKDKSYYGTWIIKKHVPTSNVSSLSKEDIGDYIGKKIIVDENQIVTSKETIKKPVFEEKTVTNSEFFENWRIQFRNIGVTGDTVTQVDVSNYKNETANGIGSTFIVTNDNKTYTFIGGALFELEK